MKVSLRYIVQWMDPVDTPSLRELVKRHRWSTTNRNPLQPISLRELAKRHSNQTTIHRFLWYNTFLLHGWRIPVSDKTVIKALLAAAKISEMDAINGIGMDQKGILGACGYKTAEDVAGLFGIEEDDVKEAFDFILTGGVSAFTDISVVDLIEEFDIVMEDVVWTLAEQGIGPIDILANCWDSTRGFLSTCLGINLPSEFAIGPKPQLDQRAIEIGQTIAREYEIAALCEVFSPERRRQVSDAASGVLEPSKVKGVVEGPGTGTDPLVWADSGLLTLTFGRTVLNCASKPFVVKGDYFRDADAWSNKGVLLTIVDMGCGDLEIYSTHLISGGDLICDAVEDIPLLNLIFPPLSDEDRISIQLAQLEELKQFYRQMHQKSNVAIVVGDFNIDAFGTHNEYQRLVWSMQEIYMHDLWPYYRYRSNPGPQDLEGVPRGDSNCSEDNNKHSRVDLICPCKDGKYCDDYGIAETETNRFDYIFVEEPSLDHTFTLDLSRIRRRPFRRPEGSTGEQYLSDHVGLDVILFCNPK